MEKEVEARKKVINRISEEKSLLLDNRTNRFKMLHGSFSFGEEFLWMDGCGALLKLVGDRNIDKEASKQRAVK